MSNNSQQKLNVAFKFPGGSEVLEIHVNRVIGVGDDTSDRHNYTMPLELETALSAVPGLNMGSIWTRTERHLVRTEISLAFDAEDVFFDIAFALASYFGVSDLDVSIDTVIDNRPLRNLIQG